MHKFNKIILINQVTFLFATITFFYLGADSVPPFGFIGLILCIFIFAFAQHFYLKGFIKNLVQNTPNTFLKNLLGFAILGIGVALSAILVNTLQINYLDYTVIGLNLMLIILPFILYSIYLYYFNIILLKIIK